MGVLDSPNKTGGSMDSASDSTEPKFALPVDSEHKATVLPIWKITRPHMLSFHLSWIAFFCAFVSTFAAAPLIPTIREALNLTKADVGNAASAAVVGAIAARILMGNFVDNYGPRYGFGLTMGLTAPCVFCMSLVTNATGFIIVRMCIGFSLAVFVACQFWCTSMFNTKIVGTANAVAAGWGNMGGGATHLIIAGLFEGLCEHMSPYVAWRWCYFLPGALQVIVTVAIMLLGQDLPDGQYRECRLKGLLPKPQGWPVWRAALVNYRTYIMCLTYGYCFGVELTADNFIAPYLFDQFALSQQTAGLFASIFGMMNLFTRALGGYLSDISCKFYGMRGRLWSLWIAQTLGGVFCTVMGLVSYSLGATIATMVIFSIFCQMSCGFSFGVVPFVSKRSTGLVSGFTGAGGNAGAAVTQAIFFTYASYGYNTAFVWMGVMTVGVTLLYTLMYFPMWGGMCYKPKPGVTEEDYYLAEFTAEERASGLHANSLKFAFESRSQRGWRKESELNATEASSKQTGLGEAAKPVASV